MANEAPNRGDAGPPRAHLIARDNRIRAGLVTVLLRTGALLVPLDIPPRAVVVAAARTLDEALGAVPEACRSGEFRLLVLADTFDPAGVRRAVRAGVRAMLPLTGVTPAQLAAALDSASHGDGQLPYQVLIRLLNGAGAEHPVESLTARQALVLRLIADGHANAAIARELSCSEHTVKNIIYDLMARLQVNNRAHAVARGIRTGLI
ncbi:LuxR C-terminal-related transcriptional regulator [Actinoplanes sp. NPDC049668]|uniref:helix-turn-helix transcriptional regulator n=1 Tax=unclassified Actinoplanes TaxID=2626549 RepID=UPI0033B300E6